jgi:hypothetical protein
MEFYNENLETCSVRWAVSFKTMKQELILFYIFTVLAPLKLWLQNKENKQPCSNPI